MVELSFFNLGRFFDLENKFIYFFNRKFGRINFFRGWKCFFWKRLRLKSRQRILLLNNSSKNSQSFSEEYSSTDYALHKSCNVAGGRLGGNAKTWRLHYFRGREAPFLVRVLLARGDVLLKFPELRITPPPPSRLISRDHFHAIKLTPQSLESWRVIAPHRREIFSKFSTLTV